MGLERFGDVYLYVFTFETWGYPPSGVRVCQPALARDEHACVLHARVGRVSICICICLAHRDAARLEWRRQRVAGRAQLDLKAGEGKEERGWEKSWLLLTQPQHKDGRTT